MALHPRLQPPTLEATPKRGNGFILAMALTVLAAGFAYAMPKAMNTSATEDPADAVVLTPTGSTHTQTATPSPTPTDEPDDGEGDGRKDNHGAAVSTAAHCDLHGRAHGEFVRSIAHDKDATVAEVEAACEAAKAAAEADATEEKVKPARGHGKPDKVKFDDDEDAVEVDDDDDDDPSAEPAETVPDDDDDDGGEGGPPDHAKGNKNKP